MKLLPLALLIIFAAHATHAAPAPEPRYFGAPRGSLAATKALLAAGDPPAQSALRARLAAADKALRVAPPSVTEKSIVAPSGNRNDYASTAPYFWPDPKAPKGAPYIRRDGQVNPESRTAASDLERSQLLARTVETLAHAYYFTGDANYAAHATRLLRVWFVDPATAMNPHLNFAQGVPGVNTGRQIGIIEGTSLVSALDAAGLLAGSTAWTTADDAALKKWAAAFFDWMTTSPFGLKEAAADNNHGTHYDAQILRLALILDRRDVAAQIAEKVKAKRIAAQIEPDGSQPKELSRATSFGYSSMNLRGFVALANLAENVGVDLWHYATPDGRSIRAALDFLVPYVQAPSKKWPYEQIKPIDYKGLAPILRQAATIYREPRYEKIAAGLPDGETSEESSK